MKSLAGRMVSGRVYTAVTTTATWVQISEHLWNPLLGGMTVRFRALLRDEITARGEVLAR